MMQAPVFIVLKSLLSLFLVWWIVFFLLREYLIDAAREDLFAARDELFDYATSIKMDYNNPAHAILRRQINLMIRFLHKLTFIRLVFTQVMSDKYPAMYRSDDMERWKASVEELPQNQRERFSAMFLRAIKIVLLQMVWRSCWLIPFALVYKAISAANKRVSKTVHRIASEKIRESLQEQEAEEEVAQHHHALSFQR